MEITFILYYPPIHSNKALPVKCSHNDFSINHSALTYGILKHKLNSRHLCQFAYIIKTFC